MALLGLFTPMCLGCVLGLVLGPLGASGGPLAAIVVRLGVVLLVLVLVVVIFGTGVVRGCCSVVVAVVGAVAAGAEADVCHANATRWAGKSVIQFAMA